MRGKKAEFFMPYLAIATWFILGSALLVLVVGVRTNNDRYILDASKLVSEANLKADIARINLERFSENSYCNAAIELAAQGGMKSGCNNIGEEGCRWSKERLIVMYEEIFKKNYRGYITSAYSNNPFDTEYNLPADKPEENYLRSGNREIFSGNYICLLGDYDVKATDNEMLKVEISNPRTPVQLSVADKNLLDSATYGGACDFNDKQSLKGKLHYSSTLYEPIGDGKKTAIYRAVAYTDPEMSIEKEYSLDEYREIAEQISLNKACLQSESYDKCEFSDGRTWIVSKESNLLNFEVKSKECKPFGSINYKFALDLNMIDVLSDDRWGEKLTKEDNSVSEKQPVGNLWD